MYICGLREVENVEHFILRCAGLVREREVLMKRMAEVTPRFEVQGDRRLQRFEGRESH